MPAAPQLRLGQPSDRAGEAEVVERGGPQVDDQPVHAFVQAIEDVGGVGDGIGAPA